MEAMQLISEDFDAASVSHEAMDELLAAGWRHFGSHFFRYNWQAVEGQWQTVIPVRIRLCDFRPSKSQRRVLRRNADLACVFVPSEIDDVVEAMFQRHKERFKDNVPSTITDFMSPTPSILPGEGRMLRCTLDGQLVAASFVDIGKTAMSSVYGVFEPAHSERSLGTFTMLREIEAAQAAGMTHHYPGYVTSGSSNYDYKKQFAALEGYDWGAQEWRPLQEFPPVVIG